MKPLTSATRMAICLDGLWHWMPENPLQPHNPIEPIQASGVIPVPGVLAECPPLQEWIGVLWYETIFQVSHHMLAQRLVLHFEAATYAAQVFVNGRQITGHEGGYASFEVAINDIVVPGDNRLSVRVSTVLDAQSCPAAEMYIETSDGQPQFVVSGLSFSSGGRGGLTGSVSLYTTPWYYVSECRPFVTTEGEHALHVAFVGEQDACYGFLQNAAGENVAEAELKRRTLIFQDKSIVFWTPGAPQLYRFDLQCVKEQGLIDHTVGTVGWTQPEWLRRKDYAIPTIRVFDFEDGKWDDLHEAFLLLAHLSQDIPFPLIRIAAHPALDALLSYCDHLGIGVFIELPEISKIERSAARYEARQRLLMEQIHETSLHPCLLQWIQPLNGHWSEAERNDLADQLQKIFKAHDLKGRDIFLFQE